MTSRLLFCVAAAALLGCAAQQPARRPVDLEVRLVAESGGQPRARWDGAEALAVESSVLFSGSDFAAVEPSLAGGDDKKTPALWLRFTPEAAQRFSDATTRYSGRRFAILIGGKVATAPKILHPITSGAFEVTGPSDEAVRAMARAAAAPQGR